MINETCKINHQFECNEKCLVYLLTWKKYFKQYNGQTIDTFRHCRNNRKSNDRKLQLSEPCMQEHLFPHFSSPGHNAFLNDVFVSFKDKTDSQDPFKPGNFVRQILMTMAPYSLILKIVSEFYYFGKIGVIIGTFYSTYILHFMGYWNAMFFQI